ncbi:hypothetical protein HYR99_06380 [Candidatus Poribacteria bacterium]|nr:hypothetical protein [Candidatus Poribacteria bacterium]
MMEFQKMTPKIVTNEFLALAVDGKIKLLVRLAHELTILARDTYEVGTDRVAAPERLRMINEIQHRVTSFVDDLLNEDIDRYPDEVLMKIILECPSNLSFQEQLQRACESALSHLTFASTGRC